MPCIENPFHVARGAAAASFGDALGGLAKLRELTVNLERNGAGSGLRSRESAPQLFRSFRLKPASCSGEEGARSLGDALKKLPSLEKLKVYLLDNKLGSGPTRISGGRPMCNV